jgi:hypothetical protein
MPVPIAAVGTHGLCAALDRLVADSSVVPDLSRGRPRVPLHQDVLAARRPRSLLEDRNGLAWSPGRRVVTFSLRNGLLDMTWLKQPRRYPKRRGVSVGPSDTARLPGAAFTLVTAALPDQARPRGHSAAVGDRGSGAGPNSVGHDIRNLGRFRRGLLEAGSEEFDRLGLTYPLRPGSGGRTPRKPPSVFASMGPPSQGPATLGRWSWWIVPEGALRRQGRACRLRMVDKAGPGSGQGCVSAARRHP